MATIKIKIFNPLEGAKIVPENIKADDHVEYDLRDKLVKTGSGEQDFRIEKEVYETSRVSRDKYIQSFSKDVGLDVLVKKVVLTGDKSILEQSKGISGDFVGFPRTNMELDDAIDAGKKRAKKLGVNLTTESLNAYVDKRVDELLVERAKAQLEAQQKAVAKEEK